MFIRALICFSVVYHVRGILYQNGIDEKITALSFVGRDDDWDDYYEELVALPSSENISRTHAIMGAEYAAEGGVTLLTEVPGVGATKAILTSILSPIDGLVRGDDSFDAMWKARVARIKKEDADWYAYMYGAGVLASFLKEKIPAMDIKFACKIANTFISPSTAATTLAKLGEVAADAVGSEVPGVGSAKTVINGYFATIHAARAYKTDTTYPKVKFPCP